MEAVARKMRVTLPTALAIDAEVDLIVADDSYFLRARLNISIPDIELEVAQRLVERADRVCPYSNATRGNIDIEINLV